MSTETPQQVDLRTIFLKLQSQMLARLSTDRRVIPHPGTKGDATEQGWLNMLKEYLPLRYQVDTAFVLDADGQLSEQIDIVIYDRQYSPFLFKQDGAQYIPAESVYAVMEVKQELSKDTLNYASAKIASVRRLRRTSAEIPYAGGVHPPKPVFEVLGGILTSSSAWSPPFGSSFIESMVALPYQGRLDLGCALADGGFEVTYSSGERPIIKRSKEEDTLIFFFLRLLSRLQGLATVPALDIAEYAKSLLWEQIG